LPTPENKRLVQISVENRFSWVAERIRSMIKIKSTMLAAIIIFTAAMLLAVDASDDAPWVPASRPPLDMVEYDAGPSYLPGRPFADQPGIREHGAYMDQLHAAGILVFGGPTFDDLDPLVISGAWLFLDVGSEAEAREIVDRDPAIAHGFLTVVDVKPFMAMIGGR
jgi:uncharacterized protein YciI